MTSQVFHCLARHANQGPWEILVVSTDASAARQIVCPMCGLNVRIPTTTQSDEFNSEMRQSRSQARGVVTGGKK